MSRLFAAEKIYLEPYGSPSQGNLKTGAQMTCRTPVEPPVEPLSNPVCCTPLIPPAGYTACPPRWRAAACREWTEDTRGQKRNEQPRCCWNACRRAQRTTRHAKGNASAASCGRFSPILKRIVLCTTDKT